MDSQDLVKTRAWNILASPRYNYNDILSNNPGFVNDHLAAVDDFRDCVLLHAPDGENVIHVYALNGLVSLNDVVIPDCFQDFGCYFVGNVDGLVCVVFKSLDSQYSAVFNPMFDQWKIPPKLEFPFPIESSTVSYGLGKMMNDGVTEYKVVRLCENVASRTRQVAVYSCSSGSWYVTNKNCSNNICHMYFGVCIEGSLNFLCYKVSDVVDGRDRCIIYALTLFSLTEKELELPTVCSTKEFELLNLFDLRNRLGLVELNMDGSRRIWGMHHYDVPTSWSIMFSLSRENFGNPRGYIPSKNELVMVELSPDVDGGLLVYFMTGDNVRSLERKLKGDDDPRSCIETCVASLVFPHP